MRVLDTHAWMLAEAVDLLENADRLQQQFFRIRQGRGRPTWEPPVDLVAKGRQLALLVALPGVTAERFEVQVEGQAVIVRGERAVGAGIGPGAILRLEIPYGHFERRIVLPAGDYQLVEMHLEHGCLRITLELEP
jgi:HSP20 family molecular chaperone IbpA